MRHPNFVRRIFAAAMLAVFGFSAVIARPLPPTALFQQDDKKQKLPPVNWIRSRKIDVKHLDIDIRFDWDKEQAMGSTIVTFAPFEDTDKFTLDAAEMTIDSVTLSPAGAKLAFAYDDKSIQDNLEIRLDRVYKAGEDVSVKIDYATHHVNTASDANLIQSFGSGLRFVKPTKDDPRHPRQIWSQGESEFNRYWFPSYDSPNDFRTTDLKATVGKDFYVVSNGKLMSVKDNSDGTHTFDWRMDQPYANYLTSVAVLQTTPVTMDFDGIPVYGFGYKGEEKEVAATTKNLPATIRFFSEITGVKYQYPQYAQSFVADFPGGMENITATTQQEEMIHDERELLDQDSESLQSHELGHQWFGDYVTCRDWGQIWLNESFATYMQMMWTEKFKGHDSFLYDDVRDNHNQVINTWNNGYRRPIVTKYYADKDALFDTYAYPAGGSVLHMLRKHLGDKLFFASLHKYLVDNAHQPVSTEDLRIAIEETTGQSMDWFFDEWLYRMGHPIFDVTQSYDEAKKQLTLNVKQVQKIDLNNEYPQTEFFQSYVDVEIDNRIERVWLKPQAENVFTFNAATKPKLVNFDYESTLLKEMKFDKSVDDLIYQAKNDKDVLGRRWAMAELGQKANGADRARIVAALMDDAEHDPFFRLRRGALSEIAIIFSPDPPPGQQRPAAKLDANVEAAVIRMTKDPASVVRGDAIELLGETQDKKFADIALAGLADQSYEVIDQSALALGRIKDPRAFEALSKLAATSSWRDRIRIAALNGLAWLGDKRALDIGLKAATDMDLSPLARAYGANLVAEVGAGDQRAFDVIADRVKQAADRNDTRELFEDLDSIRRLADPRGQQIFDSLKTKFKANAQVLQQITALETAFKQALKP
ncbi:MAG: HEAT repeat domain-containing protein [Acidobacteria bacterium]|nr:HEAT repeat domain-containing protein [Acidobacteriota bacterium]